MTAQQRAPYRRPLWLRLMWAVVFLMLLALVAQCSAENAAQLHRPAVHHPAVTQ